MRQAEFYVILGHFLPFQPPDNFKIKKIPRDIIILQTYIISDNHIMYSSWDMERNRHNFLSFWTIFGLLTPYGPRKSKFWKNEQHTWRYYQFTNVYHKWQSYDVKILRYEVQQTEFLVIVDHLLPFYPLTTRKIKILKNRKKTNGDIIILHMCTINDNHMIYSY